MPIRSSEYAHLKEYCGIGLSKAIKQMQSLQAGQVQPNEFCFKSPFAYQGLGNSVNLITETIVLGAKVHHTYN